MTILAGGLRKSYSGRYKKTENQIIIKRFCAEIWNNISYLEKEPGFIQVSVHHRHSVRACPLEKGSPDTFLEDSTHIYLFHGSYPPFLTTWESCEQGKTFVFNSFTCYLYWSILAQKNIASFQIPVRGIKRQRINDKAQVRYNTWQTQEDF